MLNMARLGKRYLLLCADLSRTATTGSNMWRLYPKHHVFAHLVSAADSNPKLSWS